MTQFSASDPVVILSYARTPMGGMQGALADVSATDLGATAVKAAVERSGVAPDKFDRTYMGCVLPAGLGQAPARQASIKAAYCAGYLNDHSILCLIKGGIGFSLGAIVHIEGRNG